MTKIQQIHKTALVAAKDFKNGESQLLHALLDVDKERGSEITFRLGDTFPLI